ncbi:MAG: hypothetical protein HY673_00020 [Chloroflexi bacterium]|nr:hypothetical protein [Chloroflexota bacterium]
MSTRPEERKVLKAMKAAKTGKEMRTSWHAQRPGFHDPAGPSSLDLYTERKPEMIRTFAHDALTQLVERGILDPKTRYLVIIGCYIMEGEWGGLLQQCCNARAAGASDEEIMEVAFIANYAVSKHVLVGSSGALQKAFNDPIFKSIKKQEVPA